MGSRALGRLLDTATGARLLELCERADSRRSNLVRVLTYHRVPRHFEAHLDFLASRYRVVGVAELLEALRGGDPLPPGAVMVTFDDGYREVGEVAWPALRRRSLPATLFVPTAYPDQPHRTFWWDRIEAALDATPRREALETPVGPVALATAADRRRACSRLKHHLKTLHHDEAAARADEWAAALGVPGARVAPILGWDDLRRLAGEGLSIGAHTRHHPFLNRLGPAAAREEVTGSLDDLRSRMGDALPIFAYPDGRYCQAAIEALQAAGVEAAFTTRRGTNDLRDAHPLLLRRINVSPDADVTVLRARLVHSSVRLNRWRHLFDPQPALRGLAAGPIAGGG